MTQELDILKGIHPGFVLDRKIKEKKLRKGRLALSVREYPQTITTITKGKRDMNTSLAVRLEKELGLEEGYFMCLQVFYDIKKEKQNQLKSTPDLSKLRPVIFWDTKMDSFDWQRQYKAIIKRVFERGNQREKDEITRFYGQDKIDEVLKVNYDVL
jgi:plasmid maintenance system antidote protein VapI